MVDGVLVVDKPQGPTSHDVVAVARRALSTRAIGHTGTLDPMATGVLALCVGQATKLSNYLMARSKVYRTTLALGQATDTLDREGAVVEEQSVPRFDSADVERAFASFGGGYLQTVPRFSAVKVDGRALHRSARAGAEVAPPARHVTLHETRVHSVAEREIDFSLRSGSGFYVRSFGRDLAEKLGTVGHLTRLRRIAVGTMHVDGAVSFDLLKAAREGDDEARGKLRDHLLPPLDAWGPRYRVRLTSAGETDASCGRPVGPEGIAHRDELDGDQTYALVAPNGRLCALARPVEDRLKIVRGFPAESSSKG
ncbi:MAG: tRNA pseudouridine(55) synthase TruB [Myxococcota bacterium]